MSRQYSQEIIGSRTGFVLSIFLLALAGLLPPAARASEPAAPESSPADQIATPVGPAAPLDAPDSSSAANGDEPVDPAAILITQQREAPATSGLSEAPERDDVGLAQVRPPAPRAWTDHVPSSVSAYPSFGSQVGRIKWETLALVGYFTAINAPKFFKETEGLHFHDEGWFGKSTANLGVDKLTHAFDTYLLAELLHWRLHRRTEAASGDALTAAVLASGLMIYSELSDGIETTSGISVQDIAMNTAGAAFSVLRNTVPGLRDKLDFRMLLMPNSDIYTRAGKRHYAQQRFLLALQLAGFDRFRKGPLRFVELHAGYYASGFTNEAIARGESPRRHLFFGLGLNVRELFFDRPTSTVGRVAATALDYLEVPYTAAHWDTHGRSTW